MLVVDEPVVTGRITGLVWQGCLDGLSGMGCTIADAATKSWFDAPAYCDSIAWGGFSNRRLSNVGELHSILNERSSTAVEFLATPIEAFLARHP